MQLSFISRGSQNCPGLFNTILLPYIKACILARYNINNNMLEDLLQMSFVSIPH